MGRRHQKIRTIYFRDIDFISESSKLPNQKIRTMYFLDVDLILESSKLCKVGRYHNF